MESEQVEWSYWGDLWVTKRQWDAEVQRVSRRNGADHTEQMDNISKAGSVVHTCKTEVPGVKLLVHKLGDKREAGCKTSWGNEGLVNRPVCVTIGKDRSVKNVEGKPGTAEKETGDTRS